MKVNPAVTPDPPALDLLDFCHSLMERSPMPMAELEGVGHVIRYVNPAFCRLIGKSPEALIGKPFAETVREGDEECLVLLDRVYRTGEAETHTGSAHPEPHPPYWSYAIWPVLGAEQCPVGVIMQVTETTLFHQQTVAMNEALMLSSVRQHELTEAAEKLNEQLQVEITTRKQVEEALARQAAALQQSNEELRQFAHVLAHDLQEPLRVVNTYAQFLAQRYQGKLDAEADTFIGYVVEGATRGQSLIRDVLLFSQVERQAQEFTEINSEEVFTDTLNVLRGAIAESGAVVTHDPLPAVRADASQLGQVFQNLLGNALKFRGSMPPRIHVSARREDRQWEFAVRDNGIGIKPQHTGQVFELFRRLHSRDEYSGTGVGLAICKRIVERHGGRMWVESAPGQGTTFFFTLLVPVGNPCMSPAPEPSVAHIAVVEDNEADVYLLRIILQKAQVPCVIDHLADGEEAVAFLLRQGRHQHAPRPDLIVLDLNLPKLRGEQVLRKIREARPDLRQVPVVVLTSSDLLHDRQTMAALGVARYLTKSSDVAGLAQIGRTLKDVLLQTKGRENVNDRHADRDDH